MLSPLQERKNDKITSETGEVKDPLAVHDNSPHAQLSVYPLESIASMCLYYWSVEDWMSTSTQIQAKHFKVSLNLLAVPF